MLQVIKYLNQNCRFSSFLQSDRILFEFANFEVVFEITYREPVDYNLNLSENKRLKELVNSIKTFDRVFISKTEYLGDRNTISDHPLNSYKKNPFSICLELFRTVFELKKEYEDLFKHYSLSTNYGLGTDFCKTDENYCFQLDISKKYLDKIKIYQSILNYFNTSNSFVLPKFYWSSYYKNEPLPERHLSILTTSTKVRRLGYFKILSNFLEERNKISRRNINRKFEDFALEYEEALKKYSNPKGLIKQTKTGISAKPYLDLSKELGFLSELNNVFSRGKDFKVYQVIRQKISANSNPFVLDRFDKMFFLEQVLLKDFFFITMLLEVIYTNHNCNYLFINSKFQDSVLNRLEEIIAKSSELYSAKTNRELREVSRRIKKWEEPKTYLEHVIMPRLNWLYDLAILEMDEKLNVKLTQNGIRLFHNFCFWNDLNTNWVFDSQNFLKLFYVHIFDDVYYDKKEPSGVKIDKEEINEKILVYLNECFYHFKTLAPNRVTASPAIKYTKFLLYLFDDIRVDHKYIEDYLDSEKNINFIYKFQKQYNDGYIQKK